MTIKELKELIENIDDDKIIVVEKDDVVDSYSGWITKIKFEVELLEEKQDTVIIK